MTADQAKAARRLMDLSEEAMTERTLWANAKIRGELLHIARQLGEAGRIALSASETWGDAWAEAGVLTLRKYTGLRKMIEHVA